MSEEKSKRRVVFYYLLGILPILLLVYAAEMHLRSKTNDFLEKRKARNKEFQNDFLLHQASPDKKLIYVMKPHFTSFNQGAHIHTNRFGYRDDDFPETPKTSKEFRVALLGDSVGWGWGVEVEKSFAFLLEKRLSEKFPDKTIHIMNFSVTGYSTLQEARTLEAVAMKFDPDLVLLVYSLNDPDHIGFGSLNNHYLAREKIHLWYEAKSLFMLIKNTIHSDESSLVSNYQDSFFFNHATQYDNVENGFDSIAKTANHHHVPVLVAIAPVFKFEMNQPYPWKAIHKKVSDSAQSLGFSVVDMMDFFEGYGHEQVGIDVMHPNEVGHDMIAERLSPIISSYVGGSQDQ